MSEFLKKIGILKDDTPKEEIVISKETNTFPETNKKRGTFIDVEEVTKSAGVFVESMTSQDSQDSLEQGQIINPFLSQLETVYNDGFIKLNKPDIDFFELYQMLLKSGNLDSLEALKMAYNMCSSMNPKLSKDLLEIQAAQYAKELMNSYEQVKQKGLTKLNNLQGEFTIERESLEKNIKSLEQQLEEMKLNLSKINDKYDPQLKEITLKKEANEIAYRNLSDKIYKVQLNIKNNL